LKNLIELKNISVRYRQSDSWVLEDSNFKGLKGEFIVVTGPSGGGKTTFIKTINGIIYADFPEKIKGDILYCGESVSKMSAAERALIFGSILQNADEQIIFEKVEDELAFALENIRTDPVKMPDLILESARMMDLEICWDTSTLSSGQKQRLISATTFSMGQKILLLDEPLANLDKKASDKLLEKLKFLTREKDYCVILVEHRLDRVFALADKFCWIENSRIKTFHKTDDFKKFWYDWLEYSLFNNCLELSDCKDNSRNNLNCNQKKLIEIKKAKVVKSGREILTDINFTLRQGERWVFIGDNGSGKTSMIKLLSNIYKPAEGKRETLIKNKDTFKRIGYVLQNPNYQLFMPTVMREISYKAVSEDHVNVIIDALNLGPILQRHPHSLSEGQKRRVGLAAILATGPDILFLDEPTVGQDYNNLGNMLKAISRIYKDRLLTMITVTHDTRCARYMGNKVLLMEKGTIKAIGGHELIDMPII